MVKNILTRIEDLHDFIEDCLREDNGITLLDKDVILENIREIYMLSRRIEVDGYEDQSQNSDSDDNESDGTSVVLFDNNIDQFDCDNEIDIDDPEPVEPIKPEVDIFVDDSFEKDDRELMIESLFDGSSERYLNFVDKINEFDDFDEAIIYIYELFSDRPTNSAIDVIVAYLEKRLN